MTAQSNYSDTETTAKPDEQHVQHGTDSDDVLHVADPDTVILNMG